MGYATLLFDLDHTLLDSASSERLAFAHALQSAGVADSERYFDTYVAINRRLWSAVERDELRPDDVKVMRFQQLRDATDIEADVAVLAAAYVYGLGAFGDLYPETLQVLDQLASRVTMALITNGIGQVQRARISRLGLDRYFKAISISGEIGYSKPGVEIFRHTFRELGHPDPESTLVVGDSLSSDIQGGINFGIATCWYNPDAVPLPDDVPVDHQIGALREVLPLVL